jgi:hypothetical protein
MPAVSMVCGPMKPEQRFPDAPGVIPQDYRVNVVRQSPSVVHLHLVR